jgi:hypothetical protein
MIIRLYYANHLLDQWWRSSHFTNFERLPRVIRERHGLEIYNGGYLSVKPGTSTDIEWFRCDLTPVLRENIPKELLVLELLNPS